MNGLPSSCGTVKVETVVNKGSCYPYSSSSLFHHCQRAPIALRKHTFISILLRFPANTPDDSGIFGRSPAKAKYPPIHPLSEDERKEKFKDGGSRLPETQ